MIASPSGVDAPTPFSVAAHDRFVDLPAIKYPENFNRITGDPVGDDDASAVGNDPQARPEVGTRPTLLWIIAQQTAALLDFLDETECSRRTVLRDESIDALKVFVRSRPVNKLMCHDGALSPSSGVVFSVAC